MVVVAARGINVGVQVATTVVLARMLSPYDFGLVAVVMALVTFAPALIDLGTTDASTQRARITHSEISALFWLNIADRHCLHPAMRRQQRSHRRPSSASRPWRASRSLSSLTFIMTAPSVQHYALMRRVMEFRRLAMIELAANVISSVAPYHGPQLVGLLGTGGKAAPSLALVAVGAWMSCPWLPGRPRVYARR